MPPRLIILLLLLFLLSFCKNETDTDQCKCKPDLFKQPSELYGKVKSVRTAVYDARTDGTYKQYPEMIFMQLFNNHGYEYSTWWLHNNGLWAKYFRAFDKSGRVIRERYENSAEPKNIEITTYEYNAVGNLVKEIKNEEAVYHNKTKYIKKFKSEIRYEYDNRCNRIKQVGCGADGSCNEYVFFKYDEKGRLTEEVRYYWDWYKHKMVEERETMKYDTSGNLIQSESDHDFYKRFEFKYDLKGNKTEICRLNSNNESSVTRVFNKKDKFGNVTYDMSINMENYSIDNDDYYYYQYDEKGNWTMKIEYKNNKPESCWKRKIEYYK